MLNITDNAVEQKIPAFFRLGYRPLFLSAAIFASVSIAIWSLLLSGNVQLQPVNSSLWWHAHEMVFGFAVAVVAGFLLTAVQTWTGQPGLRGWPLAVLWGGWLLARIGLLANFAWVPKLLLISLDVLFLPTVAFYLARPILKIKQYRNLLFIPILLLLTFCNVVMHYDPFGKGVAWGGYSAIMLITLVMTVMGGRVIPFFTANTTKQPKAAPIKSVELIALGATWLLVLAFLFQLHMSLSYSIVMATLFLLAGLSNCIRLSRWGGQHTQQHPLLWSLHLAYGFIPFTQLLLAWQFFSNELSIGSLLHGLTAGAMGTMILAMMARVSLGHSGRPLLVAKIIPSAFAAVILAGSVRLFGVLFAETHYLTSIYISSLFWVLAYLCFSCVYFPVLTQPRVDGRPG